MSINVKTYQVETIGRKKGEWLWCVGLFLRVYDFWTKIAKKGHCCMQDHKCQLMSKKTYQIETIGRKKGE